MSTFIYLVGTGAFLILGSLVLWASAYFGHGAGFGWFLLAVGGVMLALLISKIVRAIVK
jgi:hypothetical protein